MAVNKVEYNDNGQLKTLIDLTADTVTADKLAKGYTAHDMSGNIITGTMESGSGDNTLLKSVIEGSVTEITIPDGTTKIIPNIFRQNPKLKKVVIPGTVKEIGNYAFYMSTNLKYVNLNYGINKIGTFAFYNNSLGYNSDLTYGQGKIVIPDSVYEIGAAAFARNDSIQYITLPTNNNFKVVSESCFQMCDNLENIKIPDSVNTIEASAFYLCSDLKTIYIGSGVTTIGGHAFYSTININPLKGVYLSPTTPPTIASNSFNFDNTTNCKIYVPTGTLDAYKTAENWSTYANRMIEWNPT